METASTDHVTSTVTGVLIGGIGVGAAVALAPLVLPGLGLAALGTTAVAVVNAIPWVGAAVGGWIGYNKAETKAQRMGFHKSH